MCSSEKGKIFILLQSNISILWYLMSFYIQLITTSILFFILADDS